MSEKIKEAIREGRKTLAERKAQQARMDEARQRKVDEAFERSAKIKNELESFFLETRQVLEDEFGECALADLDKGWILELNARNYFRYEASGENDLLSCVAVVNGVTLYNSKALPLSDLEESIATWVKAVAAAIDL